MIYLPKKFFRNIIHRNPTHILDMSCCHKHQQERYRNENTKICMFIHYMYVDTLFPLKKVIPITFKCVTTYYQTLQTWIGDNATCYHNFKALPRICLARNNNTWPTKEIDLHLKTPEDPLVYQNLSSTPSKESSLKINSPLPVGFINKGDTCYANAIL